MRSPALLVPVCERLTGNPEVIATQFVSFLFADYSPRAIKRPESDKTQNPRSKTPMKAGWLTCSLELLTAPTQWVARSSRSWFLASEGRVRLTPCSAIRLVAMHLPSSNQSPSLRLHNLRCIDALPRRAHNSSPQFDTSACGRESRQRILQNQLTRGGKNV
jgi:hypothetical protein